jgi:tRNA-modifying protein YgfZ
MQGWLKLEERAVLAITGPDRLIFLDRLVSNSLSPDAPVYTLLLTPQGKYLHDFFVIPQDEALLLECAHSRSADLLARLQKYKLRSAVELADVSQNYQVYVGSNLPGGFTDPRQAALGQRLLLPAGQSLGVSSTGLDVQAYEQLRIQNLLPDGLKDCEFERSFPLEYNFDLANAISFTKGCYIGQELTARMRYRELLKKRLALLTFENDSPPSGSEVCDAQTNIVGQISSTVGQIALARLPLELHGHPLTCAGQQLTVTWPAEIK